MSFLKSIARITGVDKSIAYTTMSQAISAAGGFVTALFILKYLTAGEQGYYYTFKSILAIQVFFELGMNTVITQYVAHEVSHLSWREAQLEGEMRFRSRLASLLRFCLKWYVCFSMVLLLTLIIGGKYFFNQYEQEAGVEWQIPWLILCFTTALNLFITPLFSYLQGLGKIKEVARYFFYKNLLYLVSVIVSFASGAKLYALSIGNLAYIVTSLFFLLGTPLGLVLYHILKTKVTHRMSYLKEILPFQWKIAVSWISGYFIFQLFNPVVFATEGAACAGQMGMTLTVLTGIQALTYSWTSTKVPIYSGLIELRKYGELDHIFHRTVRQSVGINALLLILFFVFIYLFRHFDITIQGGNMAERFLPYIPMLLMMVPEFLNQITTAWATYLRCHKREPFLYFSIMTGLLCGLSTFVFGHKFGLDGITAGYCLISILLMPWAYFIFVKKRKEYHNPGKAIIEA